MTDPSPHGQPALTAATLNLNGVRAAVRRGFHGWLAETSPDVVLLQEVRAPQEVLRDALGPGWTVAHGTGPVAGRAGVAVAARAPLGQGWDVRVGLPGGPPASGGRWLEVDLPTALGSVTFVSCYVHAATVGAPSMDLKLAFLDAATARLTALATRGAAALLGGDLNVAHDERDLRSWRTNRGRAGFLPVEQAHLTRWVERGWSDLGRQHAGDVDGPYTWWSWRGRAFDNDAGWRIDHLWGSPALQTRYVVDDVTVDRAASYAERFSDHAPVRVRLRGAPPAAPAALGGARDAPVRKG